MVLTRRIRLWLHVCINHCFHYVCTAAGLMSAEIQTETRALQVAGHPATSLNQEALSVMVLTRRIRLWLHVCINHYIYHVCTAAGLMSAEIQAAARSL